jgi:hypothetical protein
MADWVENNQVALGAAATITKSLMTGRRVASKGLSPEGQALWSGNGMPQRNPIQTSNTFLYKNYPGMPQGGANQQQAPNGYTKNSVNGQTGPLPQIGQPNYGNQNQVNMSTPAMPASGAGQSPPQTGGTPTPHDQSMAGVGGNAYLGAKSQHNAMTNPTINPAAPIRAPRQVNP